MKYTFDQINDMTGFANGDMFGDEKEVRNYFSLTSMRLMSFPWVECPYTKEQLDEMADEVIANHWHME